MAIHSEDLLAATELTRTGRLLEATRAIQAALGWPQPAPGRTNPAEGDDVIDVVAREVYPSGADVAPRLESPGGAASSAGFAAARFDFGEHRYRYRVFVPGGGTGALLPVLVMLHGCKQDSDDFARGTGMNELAQREQVIVVYPEQLRKANSMGCWNWFEPAHQGRAGEPAMIAALSRHVAAEHGGDPARIYVAGLSAGAAMATLLGELYPDVFAAVGAHSGLPPAAAADMVSAFAAMRKGVPASAAVRAVPTIIFHGSADKTVAPRNAETIVHGQLAAWKAAGLPLTQATQDPPAAGRATRRTTWADGAGRIKLEAWHVDGGPHAWSGGHAGGSFTDPTGPSASQAMLEFFLLQRRGP